MSEDGSRLEFLKQREIARTQSAATVARHREQADRIKKYDWRDQLIPKAARFAVLAMRYDPHVPYTFDRSKTEPTYKNAFALLFNRPNGTVTRDPHLVGWVLATIHPPTLPDDKSSSPSVSTVVLKDGQLLQTSPFSKELYGDQLDIDNETFRKANDMINILMYEFALDWDEPK